MGRVEVFHAERWGTVCSDGFSKATTFRFAPDLDTDDNPTGTFTETTPANEAPALVCQSMGYDTGEYASGFGQPGESQTSEPEMTYYPVNSTYPLGDPLPIWLDDLTCAAGDADLTGESALRAPLAHCGYAGWGLHNCSHGEDAGVRCWKVADSSMAAVAEPLTAAFEGLPEAHDGETAFSFRLGFSEAVAVTPEAMRTRVLTAAGGAVTGAARVDGESGVWEITVTPDSREDLSIALARTEDCEAEGAVCTSDGRTLSVVPAHIVPGPGPETEPALTAAFEGLPEAHDGEEGFHFRVAFSEEIGIGFRSMRDDSFTVDGGEVTGARRVDRRHDLWRITVEPDGEGDVTVTLAAGRECAVSGAICTRGGDRRQLTNTATATVAGPVDEDAPAVLTASFVEAPHEHDGETAFKLRIAFSEGISIGFRTFRDQSLSVSGGSVTKAKRVDRRKDLWEVTVEPGSLGDVTVTLAGGRACGTAGAVCTGDGRALSATISTTVLGPVALSVADARVREASDVTLDFAVTLSRASRAPVAVAYATADGSATAGSDYTATSGTLTFAAGETAKTVSVPVLDDAHDEGEETLTLRLSAATGAVIADGVATGTIENTDHMPAAWLARFGRTVTDQVLSVVEARLAAPRTAGARATLAGQALPSWDGGNDTAKAAAGDNADASDRALRADARDREAMTAIRDWMAHAGADGAWRAPGEGPEGAELVQSRALTGRDFLTGTSFALTGGSAEAGGYAALWGRGAISRFDGREGDLTLDGEVTTALMGADWAAERWTAGLAIGHARGTGGYSEGGGCTAGADDNGASGCAGEVEATLSGVWPYAGLTLTDRLSAWAAAGYGAGSLTLTPGGETDGPFTADLTMTMGAAGMRGEVLTPPPEGGLALALKGDARLTRTASEATKDAKGRQPRGGDRRRVAGAYRDRGLAALRARRRCRGAGADAVVRAGRAAGRRRRRDRARRRPRRRARLRGAEAGYRARSEGARAGRPPSVGLPRMGRERLPRLGPAAVDGPGARADAAPVLGRLADRRHGRAAGPRDPGRPRRQRERRHDRDRGPSGGGAGLRHRDVRGRLHRHAASRRRALGDRARLPPRLAPDLGAARRSGLRDQPRRDAQRGRQRRCRARHRAPRLDPLVAAGAIPV